MGRSLILGIIIGLSLVTGCSSDTPGDAFCGYSARRSGARGILNGAPDSSCQYNQVLKMQVVGTRAVADCSGVLVRSDAVLSAAHCIADPQLGTVQGIQVQAGPEILSARKWVANPGFVPTSRSLVMYGQDLAIIFLAGKISGPAPVKLATINPSGGAVVTAVGFGFDGRGADGNGALGRRLVGVLRVEQDRSGSDYALGITAVGAQQTCEGDSGGPLIHDGIVVGILSGGDVAGSRGLCIESVTSVYSPVANFMGWIQRTLSEN